DQLICEQAVLDAMRAAAGRCGSAGAGLVLADDGIPVNPALSGLRYAPPLPSEQNVACHTRRLPSGTHETRFDPVRPLPERDTWFESAWRKYRLRTQPS
ncbi:MAG TPA: hypothetical protein PKE04_16970, partial [Clostridia bacterium]|nr:hypothetical protein [Clostridia bacterium]